MATAPARNTPEVDRLIIQSTPVAEAEATERINFRGEDATIRTRVGVYKCPQGFRSRLGYHARLYLTRADGVERNIGYITAWRLSRPTGVNPNVDAQYYLAEWYFRRSDTYDRDSRQLASCFRAIYGPGSFEGDYYDRIVDEEKKDALRDGGHEIVFIQTIYVKWREDPDDKESGYSGNGLASKYLNSYYRLLGGKILPAWFTLSGPVTYLMIPRLHSEPPVNEVWRVLHRENNYSNQELAVEVIKTLNTAFKRQAYGYKVYVTNARVFDTDISVLGRVVEVEESLSRPGDRPILPAAGSSSADS